MKKQIGFIMTMVLGAMLLTGCGSNSSQSNGANALNQASANHAEQESSVANENNAVQDSNAANENDEAETNVEEMTEDTADTQQTTEDANDGQTDPVDSADAQTGKVLVVYYSASGNKDALPSFGRTDIPQASAVIMQYTGYSAVSEKDAPTYVCVGTSDGIASWKTMQSRLQSPEALGIPTEFHAYEGFPHGFGIGTGTVAEGWIQDAAAFWEAQCE